MGASPLRLRALHTESLGHKLVGTHPVLEGVADGDDTDVVRLVLVGYGLDLLLHLLRVAVYVA